MPENTNIIETHGCIVCGKIYSVLVVHDPDNHFVDCRVNSPDAHRVMNETDALVACNRHSPEEIEKACTRWIMKNDPNLEINQGD